MIEIYIKYALSPSGVTSSGEPSLISRWSHLVSAVCPFIVLMLPLSHCTVNSANFPVIADVVGTVTGPSSWRSLHSSQACSRLLRFVPEENAWEFKPPEATCTHEGAEQGDVDE